MKRRNFFQGLTHVAVIVALAPQLAFRVRPAAPMVAASKTLWFSNGETVMVHVASQGVINCVAEEKIPWDWKATPFKDKLTALMPKTHCKKCGACNATVRSYPEGTLLPHNTDWDWGQYCVQCESCGHRSESFARRIEAVNAWCYQ